MSCCVTCRVVAVQEGMGGEAWSGVQTYVVLTWLAGLQVRAGAVQAAAGRGADRAS